MLSGSFGFVRCFSRLMVLLLFLVFFVVFYEVGYDFVEGEVWVFEFWC